MGSSLNTAGGSDYRSYLKVRSVPSLAPATRLCDWELGRPIVTLSGLERRAFRFLVQAQRYLGPKDKVIYAREQVPLDSEETLDIAHKMQVVHPRNPRTKRPIVMTTDLVVTYQKLFGTCDVAYCVKPAAKLAETRIAEKIEIERRYWEAHGVRFVIITEKDIPQNVVDNIEKFYAWREPSFTGMDEATLARVEEALRLDMLDSPMKPIAEVAADVDARLGFPPGSCMRAVRYFLASSRWRVDLTVPIDPQEPLRLLEV